MSQDDLVLVETNEGVTTITLNNPATRNAVSYPMQVALNEALLEADNDTSVHCVVLKGAGGNFSSGYDVTPGTPRFPELGPQPDGRNFRETNYYESFDNDAWTLQRGQDKRMYLFDMYKPVIAQVEGICIAGGTDLALLCDMVIVADDARIGFPAVRDMGSPPNHMWLYHVGPQWAKRMLLTGDLINGKNAAKIGLALKSVPAKKLEREVAYFARRLALIDPELLATNKRIVNLGMEIMGARTLQRLAIESDARGHLSKAARNFRETAAKGGLKAAFADRAAKFGSRMADPDGPEFDDDD